MFGDLTERIISIPQLKNKSVISLFERIISSEKLSPTLLTEIIEFRKNHESFNQYDRSVIVSSITLSVLTCLFLTVRKLKC